MVLRILKFATRLASVFKSKFKWFLISDVDCWVDHFLIFAYVES